MPTFYNYTENGQVYSFDDVFVPADAFREGNLWVWGQNIFGQLGINNTTGRTTPVTTFAGGANWKQVSADPFTAAVKTDGTLWVWGYNVTGSLGINNTNGRTTPVTTFAGGADWKQVDCGGLHTAAVKTDGTLWIWGYNVYGTLGINSTTGRTTPVTTFAGGTNWKQVSCGYDYTAAIKTDGTLWTWGRNSYGQLGINAAGVTTGRTTPVTTFAGGNNWKQVGCSRFHVGAVKTDGSLWTWGRNNFGQLGINNTTDKNTPVTTSTGGNNWKQVACAALFTTAVKTDGTLWTWGQNSVGQLGTNNNTQQNTPVTTFAGGNNWKQVECGYAHAAAIKTNGTLWTWGRNSYGELGVNNTTNRLTPVTTLLGGTNWKQVACGGNSTVATTYIDFAI